MRVVVRPEALARLSPTERAAAEAELRELEELGKANPLAFYRPHAKQHLFHASTDPLKLFLGGNRAGKTTAGIVDSLVQALPASALPDHLRQYKRWQPPFFCRVVVPDLGSTLEGVTLQKIREWCPPAELSGGNFDNAWDSKLRLLRFRCGSWFQFLSNDQDLNKFGGAALHRVLYDEEPREDIRRECLFRLIDYDGDELFTMTPQWGLCVDTETECLTKRGWLRHDELRDTDILLSYNIERGVTEWTPLRGVYRNEHYDGPMLRTVGHLEAVFTPEHRWVTPSGLREFRELKRADKVIVSAPHQNVNESTFSPELMEIIGWVLSEGSVLPNENKVAIYQSVSRYPQHCARIEALLKACSAQYHSADRSYPTRSADGTVRRFVVTGEVARKIRWLVGYPKKLRPELIASLDPECVRALLTGLLDGDGHLRRHGTWEFTSREKDLCDGVAMLSVLIGRRTTMVTYRSPQGKPVWRTRSSAGRSAIHEFQKRARECPAPSGGVWCPSTDNGTFVARRNGRAFITGNSWVYDEIFEPWEQGRLDGCTIITVGLDDNPHLSAAGKARAIAGVSVEERQAREKGRFVHFAGPIYPEFDRTRHVIPEIAEVPETATVIAGIDPGIGRQAAVVFAYLGVDDVLVIFDEIAGKGATVAEICAEYHRRCEFWKVKPRWNVIDPSARNREMSTGKELAAAYARCGVYTIPGQNSQGFGFNIGKERLETDRLLVTANCVVFIRQIQKYRWRSDPRSPEGTPANRPIKRDDHTLDAARYIWASPMVTPKQPSREEPTTMKDRLLREHLKSLRRPTVSHPAGPGVFA